MMQTMCLSAVILLVFACSRVWPMETAPARVRVRAGMNRRIGP